MPSAGIRVGRGVLLAGALWLGPTVGCESEEAPVVSQAPVGSRPELERWVVHLAEDLPDDGVYRDAQDKGGEAVAAASDALRQEAKQKRLAFGQRLSDLGGRIVDHWFLTPAVTVELPGGNVPTLRVLEGVTRVEPEATLTP